MIKLRPSERIRIQNSNKADKVATGILGNIKKSEKIIIVELKKIQYLYDHLNRLSKRQSYYLLNSQIRKKIYDINRFIDTMRINSRKSNLKVSFEELAKLEIEAEILERDRRENRRKPKQNTGDTVNELNEE